MEFTEKDGKIFVSRPLCPICLYSMKEHGLKYQKGTINNDDYSMSNFSIIQYLSFICKDHPQMKMVFTQKELDKLNEYPNDSIVYTEIQMNDKIRTQFKSNIGKIINNAINKK